MRSVIVTNIMSIDGKFEGPGGNPLALNMDSAFDRYNLERIQKADLVLLGATSFQMFSGFWPHVADAPLDPTNAALSDTNRAFGRAYNALPKAVVTDAYTPPMDNPWYATTTVVSRADVDAWRTQQRDDGDGDIVLFASHITWNGLLAAGLIDEIHLVISPSALGDGTPLFTSPAKLTPLEARPLPNSSNLLVRYAAAPERFV